jgi:hypothetical protein
LKSIIRQITGDIRSGPGLMPRTSAAAASLVLLQGQAPLPPPPGLSAAERKVFVATVKSVKFDHFQPEDLPILAVWCSTIVQREAIAGALDKDPAGEDVPALRIALSRTAGDITKLCRALRLGPISRDATNRRRPGTTRQPGQRPWDEAG